MPSSQRPVSSGGTINGSSPPTPVAITKRRRTLDIERRLEQQYARGRPTDGWKLCGDMACWERCCINRVPEFVLQDREWSTDKIPVKDISTDFAAIVTHKIWRSNRWKSDNLLMKLNSVESFVTSPPVRAAFQEFKTLCRRHNIAATKEVELRDELTVATPRFYELMGKIGKPEHVKAVHGFLKPPKAAEDDPDGLAPVWTLQYCIMRFLLTVELWRRSDAQHLRRRLWTFESPKIAAELLTAVLLNYWLMDREKCFESVPCTDSLLWDEAWQRWMDGYALLTREGEEDDDYTVARAKSYEFVPLPAGALGMDVSNEVGYIGAVGICEPGWRCLQREGGDELPLH